MGTCIKISVKKLSLEDVRDILIKCKKDYNFNVDNTTMIKIERRLKLNKIINEKR